MWPADAFTRIPRKCSIRIAPSSGEKEQLRRRFPISSVEWAGDIRERRRESSYSLRGSQPSSGCRPKLGSDTWIHYFLAQHHTHIVWQFLFELSCLLYLEEEQNRASARYTEWPINNAAKTQSCQNGKNGQNFVKFKISFDNALKITVKQYC